MRFVVYFAFLCSKFVGLNISLWVHDDWKYIPIVFAIVKQWPISMILYKIWIDYRSKYENKAWWKIFRFVELDMKYTLLHESHIRACIYYHKIKYNYQYITIKYMREKKKSIFEWNTLKEKVMVNIIITYLSSLIRHTRLLMASSMLTWICTVQRPIYWPVWV